MIRKHWKIFLLVVIVLAIRVFSLFPNAVEQYYSQGFYPLLASFQRIILGWIPFSIGDLLYIFAGLYLFRMITRFAWQARNKNITKAYLLRKGEKLLTILLVIYIWFNISWGLNYNRIGIAAQLGIENEEVQPEDIAPLAGHLAAELNKLANTISADRNILAKKSYLFEGAVDSYKNLEKKDEFFGYAYPSVKPSMFSYLGNYLGYTGYYNPFTGEAQVNTTVPLFIQPFTTCHEIGHQLGYGKESEANMSAFLSASVSDDPLFRYSVYFEMLAYTRPYLYATDSLQLKTIDSTLHPLVTGDFRRLREFYQSHRNPVERMIDILYGQYLRMNEQPSGKLSYNEVVVLLTKYFKRQRIIPVTKNSG